jgi:putative oxidoreductase
MNVFFKLTDLHKALGRGLDWLQPLALLAARVYVADVFMRSGWLKVTAWSTTLDLFRDEYHVPLLPPDIAAIAGTFGELFFPALLLIGLFSRVGAIGAFVVNAMAVISYSDVLLAEGYEAALGNHILWGTLLLGLMVFGSGRISIDAWLEHRAAAASGRSLAPAVST